MPRNIVIVRAGKKSLHHEWLLPALTERTWDLWVSWYEEPSEPLCHKLTSFDRGSKLTGLAHLFTKEAEILSRYDYFFFPDDDLQTSADEISKLFLVAERYNLALCQPALSPESFINRDITLKVEGLLLRLTNWIESMAPCFSRAALAACLPTFTLTHSGWGQEVLWCKILAGARIGIVDAAQVLHTRPLGGPNYDQVRLSGTDAICEMLALYCRHQLTQPLLKIEGVVTDTGQELFDQSFDTNNDNWIVAPW